MHFFSLFFFVVAVVRFIVAKIFGLIAGGDRCRTKQLPVPRNYGKSAKPLCAVRYSDDGGDRTNAPMLFWCVPYWPMTHSCVRVRRLSTRVKLRGIRMSSAQTNEELKKKHKSIASAVYSAISIHPLDWRNPLSTCNCIGGDNRWKRLMLTGSLQNAPLWWPVDFTHHRLDWKLALSS